MQLGAFLPGRVQAENTSLRSVVLDCQYTLGLLRIQLLYTGRTMPAGDLFSSYGNTHILACIEHLS
jgi:hypothetical protein